MAGKAQDTRSDPFGSGVHARERPPIAAPNLQGADGSPVGGSVFGTEEMNSWAAPLAQKGSALRGLFWALMNDSFIGGPVSGPPGGPRFDAPACFF